MSPVLEIAVTLLVAVLLVVGVGTAFAQSETVYVTKTGEKYHNDGCQYLRQSRIPMSLKEFAKRFDPCSVCKPPAAR